MDPSTTLTVTAKGGDGAVGSRGTLPVEFGLSGPNDYKRYPGTPGGKGGDGGRGGLVTVHCTDAHWQSLVHVDNNGGAGGPGGPGASQGPSGHSGANGVVHRS